jgi:hypothetical protein
LKQAVRVFLTVLWVIVSFAVAFVITLILMDLLVMSIIFDDTLTFVLGWSLVFVVFSVFQGLMYKSGLLSSKRLNRTIPKEASSTGVVSSNRLSGNRPIEQSGLNGIVQNLKKERDLTFFSLMVSGAAKPTFYWVEADVKDLSLNEGNAIWLKGELGKDGTLRTTEVKNLSETPPSGEALVSANRTLNQGHENVPVVRDDQQPIHRGVTATGSVEKRNCPMCGGTGEQKIMQWKTVMEPQTVYEQVTQFRFGKPVKVTVPRTVQKAVQKPDYKMVPCNTCKGTGKI